MKKLAFLGGAAGLGLLALLGTSITQAADHADSNSAAANPMADINDVYVWMSNTGANISMAMTVSPFDDGTRNFGPSVKYAFHLTQYTAFPQSAAQIIAGEEAKVICTFESNSSGQCWVIDAAGTTVDYVSGDFSAASGVTSTSGKTKVFAGRRSDPFFFNLAGFLAARTGVEKVCGSGTPDTACPGDLVPNGINAAGCPSLNKTQVDMVAPLLSSAFPATVGPCPANQKDCFANANVMAIVVEIDKTLVVPDTTKVMGVWGSTNQ